MEYPKPKTIKNTDYENFTRKPGEHFHHESSLPGSGGGKSLKCSSYYGISIPPELHRKREAVNGGFITSWAEHFGWDGHGLTDKELRDFIVIELLGIVIKNLIAYIESKRPGGKG